MRVNVFGVRQMRALTLAAAALAAAFSCVPALAYAADPTPAPGSAVKAAQTSTRATTAPVTSSGLLLPPFSVGQVELCSAEGTISPSTLRFGILLNIPHDVASCDMRRDSRTLADLSFVAMAEGRAPLAAQLLDASIARMCDGRANRAALVASGVGCVVKP